MFDICCTGPILLTKSYQYVSEWLNEHPFNNETHARLICNSHNGSPIKPEALLIIMDQLRKRILKFVIGLKEQWGEYFR